MNHIITCMLAAAVFTACAQAHKTSSENQSDEAAREAAADQAEQTPTPAAPPPITFPNLAEKSPNTRRLMNYLADEYGVHIQSGQQDTSWTVNRDIDMIARVYTVTGKYPAVKGFDFLMLPYDGGREQTQEAAEWWNGQNNGKTLVEGAHGIVTFAWHWRPARHNFYTKDTDFRIPFKDGQLDTESEDFAALLSDMNIIAQRLAELKRDDIPVLWRPLHEAAGGWFWWGASGAEPYIALWRYMYDYFTREKGLDNLIWVWNGQNSDWYPGDDTVDMAGYDSYPQKAQDYRPMRTLYNVNYLAVKGKKIIAMTENGEIPDPDLLVKDGVPWSWFCTWNDGNAAKEGETHKDNFWSGEFHNTDEHKKKVYNHEYVITLDKLPDLTAYRLD